MSLSFDDTLQEGVQREKVVGDGESSTIFHNVLQGDQEKKDAEEGNMFVRFQKTNINYQLSH